MSVGMGGGSVQEVSVEEKLREGEELSYGKFCKCSFHQGICKDWVPPKTSGSSRNKAWAG